MTAAFGVWGLVSFVLIIFGSFVGRMTFRKMDWEQAPPQSIREMYLRSLWVTNARAKKVIAAQPTNSNVVRANKAAKFSIVIGVLSLTGWGITIFAMTFAMNR